MASAFTALRGYKQTALGWIPEEWAIKELGNIAPLQRGFDLPLDSVEAGDFPVVYSNGILRYHKISKAKAPGIVTGRSGTIGKVTFLDQDYWPHNTSLWVTDFCGNDPVFVFHLFVFIGLERFAAGSGVPTLNRNDVHSHKVPLPPLPEQRAIAAVLGCWDKAIGHLSALIAQKQARKNG